MDWFAPFQAAYNARLWNAENGFAQALLDEAAWQLEVGDAHTISDRRCAWSWPTMRVRTDVEWQRGA